MRYVACAGSGGPEVMHVADAPTPTVKAGEVLIEVAYAGVNRPDVIQRQGHYPPPPGASPILGLEVSGRVVAAGPGVNWPLQDTAVCALVNGGGYAEFVTATALHCLPVPGALPLREAAGLPEAAFTVWHNVFERGRLRAGETLLVHGGSGGIGAFAIQLARARGARVAATGGGPEKCRAIVEFGADRAIDYRTEDFVHACREFTNGHGADVILDIVGGDYLQRNLKACAPDGRIVSIAFLKGSRAELDVMQLMMKRITWTGSTLRAQSVEAKATIAEALRREVWPLLNRGLLRPHIHAAFKLESAGAAHAMMERSEHIGKIVIEVKPA